MAGDDASQQAWDRHYAEHAAHNAVHEREHLQEGEVVRTREQARDTAFLAHQDKHAADDLAIKTALAAVKELADIHSKAHEREHAAHEQRHEDAKMAVAKAEESMDKRLESLNEFRLQLRDQAHAFASQEYVDAKHDSVRIRIEALERVGVKQEGKSLGQGTVVAIIVGSVGFIATVLGVVVVVVNLVAP